MPTTPSLDADKMVLKGVLNRAGSVSEAAKILGIGRHTLRQRAKKYNLLKELKEVGIAGKTSSRAMLTKRNEAAKPTPRVAIPVPANIPTGVARPKPITRSTPKGNIEERLALSGEMREAHEEQDKIQENLSNHQSDDFFAELQRRLGASAPQQQAVEAPKVSVRSHKKMIAHALLTLVPILVSEYHSEG